jgi:hypothetical protein
MGNKKNHLYQALLITGIAVTIFSLWGILVITSSLPLAQRDAPAARDSTSESRATSSRPRTPMRTLHAAQNPCDPCDGEEAIRATASLSDPLR